MTVGDGSAWDESNPTNSTLATSIDDYDRDLRVGVRSRMALEHEWPTSQSATNQAGQHKFITMQNQSAKPTVSGTQLAAIYTKTVGSGLQEMFWENEAGTEVQLTSRTGAFGAFGGFIGLTNFQTGGAIVGATTTPFDDSIPQITEGNSILSVTYAAQGATNSLLVTGLVHCAETSNDANHITVSLHADYGFGAGSTSDAIWVAHRPCAGSGTAEDNSAKAVPIHHYIASIGTTANVVYSIRVGADVGSVIINGSGSSRIYGGVLKSELTVSEVRR